MNKTAPLTPGYLETTINRILSMDDESRLELVKYAGRVIVVELTNTQQVFNITIIPTGISLEEPSVNPDIIIRGTPGNLLAYFMAMKRDEPGKSGTIEIAGNIALAQKILAIISNLDPEWEEELSRWVGDSVAHGTGNTIRSVMKQAVHAATTLRNNTGEYLLYESDLVPDRQQVYEFNREVDSLRNDVERLKLRMSRLYKVAEGK
jgi:ubiquinone biosynthesis protein UbiJ